MIRKPKRSPEKASFNRIYTPERRDMIKAAIPLGNRATKRNLLDDALAIAHGTRSALLADEMAQRGTLTRLSKELRGLSTDLERACETLTSGDRLFRKVLREAMYRVDQPLAQLPGSEPDDEAEETCSSLPRKMPILPFYHWSDVDSTRADDDMDLRSDAKPPRMLRPDEDTIMMPNWNIAIVSLQALRTWAKRASADVDEFQADQRAELAGTPGRRRGRDAVISAAEHLADAWTDRLGEPPTLKTGPEKVNKSVSRSKTVGPFLDFAEVALRPILPPHYDNRSLEGAVRQALYGRKHKEE